MKSRGFLVRLLMALVCLLPVGIGMFSLGDSAFAADAVDVTLHKKKMDAFPTELTENTGKKDSRFDQYVGFPDVTFSAWNITDDFYNQLNGKLTGSENEAEYKAAVKKLMLEFQLNKSAAKKVGADQTTDSEGEAKFNGLPMRNDKGLYNIYYFEEHAKPDVEIGTPLILTLPAIDVDNGEQLTDIHLYPKNKVEGLDVDKEILDENGAPLPDPINGVYDYDIGKKIQFRASFTIPSQIGEILTDKNGAQSTRYTKLEFVDRLDQNGVKFEGIDKITMGGSPIDKDAFLKDHTVPKYYGQTPDYTDNAGFEIKTNLNNAKHPGNTVNYNKSKATADYLKNYAGKRMEIYYSVSLTEHTKVDQEINNTFTVTFTNEKDTNKEESNPEIPAIITGGKRVLKFEDGNGQGLGGAKFVVIKKDGNDETYLKFVNGEVNWVPVGTNEKYDNAKQYVSGDDGKFAIEGLSYGTYYLREIKAPDGFVKLTADRDFEVNKGSYAESEVLMVENISKDGILPSTGGAGIIAFLIIGGALMSIAVIRYRKSQHAV